MKNIDIHQLQPGMVIVQVTQQNGPIKIKKSGLVTSQHMVQGLIEMGIQQVEIDPDQTVELEVDAPEIKKSAMQKMLTDSTSLDNRANNDISNQFHRSLFLPTVQELPSAWQFYAKRYLLLAFIAIGGIGFGWSIASYQNISDYFVSSSKEQQPVEAGASTTLVKKDIELQPAEQQQSVETLAENTASQSAAQQQVAELTKQVQNLTQAIQKQQDTQQALNDENIPTNEANSSTRSELASTVNPSVEQQAQQSGPIPEELVNRFNQALSEVTEQSQQLDANTDKSEGYSVDKLPNVDQLPAWVMTELPSMAFSAHMYASNSEERWVRVNGMRLQEGDMIENKVRILAIEPQRIILHYSGHEFSMEALTDW
jgi:general secretion pathway protein B